MSGPLRAGLTRLPQELLLLSSNASPFLRRSSLLSLRTSLPRGLPRPAFRCLHQSLLRRDERQGAPEESETPATFEGLAKAGLIDRRLVDIITKEMDLHTMTPVQRMTINEALKGDDVLAQAKTGTGKTMGFLLPVVQNIAEKNPELLHAPRARRGIRYASSGRKVEELRAIVISPTRELAEQIATVARRLVNGTSMVVQVAVGGTAKDQHLRQLRAEGCHLLVATPGRLKDILSDPRAGIAAPNVHTLVLDEADRLLDDGFLPDIKEIEAFLPDKATRQTLMYSATVPREVTQLARNTMRPGLHLVRTVSEDEVPTHELVKQNVVYTEGVENIMPALFELVRRETEACRADPNRRPFKAIIYFGSTIEVQWAQSLFQAMRRRKLFHILPRELRFDQIHSRLTQAMRTRAADEFRRVSTGVLLSTDVTARGMDFPGVTHVIQTDMPRTREPYIHRLGRTARAGAEGEGWLFVPGEPGRYLLKQLRDLPFQENTSLVTAKLDLTQLDDGNGTDDAEFDTLSDEGLVKDFSKGADLGDVRAIRTLSMETDADQSFARNVYTATAGRFAMFPDRAELRATMDRFAKVMFDAVFPESTLAFLRGGSAGRRGHRADFQRSDFQRSGFQRDSGRRPWGSDGDRRRARPAQLWQGGGGRGGDRSRGRERRY